jgi:hypothetical protein
VNLLSRRPSPPRFWIVLPAILLTISDAALTLLFQPSTYWSGEFATAHEVSPLGAAFLHIHPLAFGAFMLAWASLIVIIASRLNEPWNRVGVLMIVLGHTAGVSDWLEDLSYVGALPAFFIAALVTVYCWRRSDAASPARATIQRPRGSIPPS